MNEIKKIVKKSGTSFFWSMSLLPKAKRLAMYTLYAFCRHIDDIVDGDLTNSEKMSLLNAWREEMDNIYDKKVPASDIGRKIYKNCMRFKLPKAEFITLIDGVSMDLPKPMRAPNLKDLLKYCRGVAGAPGNLSLRIFGLNDEILIEKLSVSLGNALQLTNILRDVKEDAQAGRLYIPKEYLKDAEILSNDPLCVVVDPDFAIAREELGKLALEYFHEAEILIRKLNKNTARPVKIMFYTYKKYFEIMFNRGWEIMSPKPKISRIDRLRIVARAFLR